MVENKFVEIKNFLVDLFRQINIRVDKIIIFGSYSREEYDEESDMDIVIVSKDFRGKDLFEIVELTKDIHWNLVDKLMRPFDILYYSDEEWEEGNSLIINEAKKDGIVIYG